MKIPDERRGLKLEHHIYCLSPHLVGCRCRSHRWSPPRLSGSSVSNNIQQIWIRILFGFQKIFSNIYKLSFELFEYSPQHCLVGWVKCFTGTEEKTGLVLTLTRHDPPTRYQTSNLREIIYIYLLYIRISGFQRLLGGTRISLTLLYSETFHLIFVSVHSWRGKIL